MDHRKAYEQRHRDAGLCVKCNQKATHGGLCQVHLDKKHRNMKDWRRKKKESGECPRCGLPLHEEMDAECVACLTCRTISSERIQNYRLAG